MRPPALCVQDEVARDSASSYRDGTASTTSSRRSTLFRAVEEAGAARTAVLQAEAEAQRALARLADTRAECNEQHKAITAELEATQDSVKCSLRATTQQTTVQAAKVDAIGYRQEEMEDLFLQRELRTEVQMAELNNKMHTLGAASHRSHLLARWCLCAPPVYQSTNHVENDPQDRTQGAQAVTDEQEN